MIDFTDMLVFAGMVFLRFGVPLLIVIGIGYLLKRLDRRWEAEAWAEQRKATGAEAEVPAEQPSIPAPTQRPTVPARTPAPAPVLPFIPPPVRETPRPQPGMTATRAAQPCYDVKGCSDTSKAQCAAPQHPEKPCWQARFDAEGAIPEDCVGCDIFQRYPMM
jgi:hypothetical protein